MRPEYKSTLRFQAFLFARELLASWFACLQHVRFDFYLAVLFESQSLAATHICVLDPSRVATTCGNSSFVHLRIHNINPWQGNDCAQEIQCAAFCVAHYCRTNVATTFRFLQSSVSCFLLSSEFMHSVVGASLQTGHSLLYFCDLSPSNLQVSVLCVSDL